MKSVPWVTQLDGVGLGRVVRGPDPAAGLPCLICIPCPWGQTPGGRRCSGRWGEGGPGGKEVRKGGTGESASGAVSALSPDTPPSGSPHPLSPPPPQPHSQPLRLPEEPS